MTNNEGLKATHFTPAASSRGSVEIPDSTGGEISLSADEREPPKVEDL